MIVEVIATLAFTTDYQDFLSKAKHFSVFLYFYIEKDLLKTRKSSLDISIFETGPPYFRVQKEKYIPLNLAKVVPHLS